MKKLTKHQKQYRKRKKEALRDTKTVINESGFKGEWKGKWVSHFTKIAVDNVTPPFVTIGGYLDLTSYEPNGVESIKEALLGPKASYDDTTLKIYSNGSPSYRVSVKAPNYKQAEEELKNAVDTVLNIFKDKGGLGSFERR